MADTAQLQFTVANQTIERTDSFVVVEDSEQYLYAKFTFATDDWDGLTKTALFITADGEAYPSLCTDGVCQVPHAWLANEQKGAVGVLGTDGNIKITTRAVTVQVYTKGYDGEAVDEGDTQSYFDKLMAAFTEAMEAAAASAAAAKTSETNAEMSAVNAAGSESAAKTAAEAAAASETNSAGSASAAALSAADAANSAEAASTSETNASESASDSASSASSAEGSASAAAEAAARAAGSADNAAASAKTAEDQVAAIGEKVAEAENSLSELTTAISNAGTAAEAADTARAELESTTAAANGANTALQAIVDSADQIRSDVESAATAASASEANAADSAAAAKASETNAASSATASNEAANTAAENSAAAKTSAEEAKASATAASASEANAANSAELAQAAGQAVEECKEIAEKLTGYENDIDTMKSDITSLQGFVGTLPDDTDSTTVIEYIQEKAEDAKYTHPSYTPHKSGLYNITVDGTGHVSEAAEATKEDITALGIPAQDTTYGEATDTAAGLMSAADKGKLDGIEIPSSVSVTIPITGWGTDSSADYPQYYDIPVTGVTANYRADIMISPDSIAEAASCGVCPTSETLSGKIRIRATSVPSTAISAEYWIMKGKG